MMCDSYLRYVTLMDRIRWYQLLIKKNVCIIYIYIYIDHPKNHGISKLVAWKSQNPAMQSQIPLLLEGPMVLMAVFEDFYWILTFRHVWIIYELYKDNEGHFWWRTPLLNHLEKKAQTSQTIFHAFPSGEVGGKRILSAASHDNVKQVKLKGCLESMVVSGSPKRW